MKKLLYGIVLVLVFTSLHTRALAQENQIEQTAKATITQTQGRFNKFDPRLKKSEVAEKTTNSDTSSKEKLMPSGTSAKVNVETLQERILKRLESMGTFLTKFQTKVNEAENIDADIRTWMRARISVRQSWLSDKQTEVQTVESVDDLRIFAKAVVVDWKVYRPLGLLYSEVWRFNRFTKLYSRLSEYVDVLSQKNVDTTAIEGNLSNAQDYFDEAKKTLTQINEETVGEGYRAQSQEQLKQAFAELRLALGVAKEARDSLQSPTDPATSQQLEQNNE